MKTESITSHHATHENRPESGKVRAFARLLSEILEEPEEIILAELLASRLAVPQLRSM